MFSRTKPVAMSAPRPSARFSVDVPAEMLQAMTGGGSIAPRISRNEAMQVPAVMRARNLICGSLGTLPIRVHGPDRRVVTDVQYLVPQPDPDIPNSVMMANTYEDLFFETVAWWRVTKWGWHGYPVEARHVPVGSVHVAPTGSLMPSQTQISPDQPFPAHGKVFIDGIPVADHEVIRFDSPNPPFLRHAARAIRTCLLLDTAAALYAKDPLPLGFFAPTEGADPADDADIEEMLDDWNANRAKRAWGYVPAALKAQALQWNPEQLQLADQRQHAVLEIARAAGVDPEDLGVSTTSRTYANQEQRNQALINFTLGAYAVAIQDRLSMRDVLPRGYMARIDFAGFLRGDTLTRMQTYEVGLRVGAYVKEEIRELEDRPALTAAQRAESTPPPAAPMPAEPAQAPAAAQQERREDRVIRETVKFSAVETVSVQFEARTEDFQVDAQRRTIVGLILPWGKVANNGFAKWRFAEGSVNWSDVSRIKLNQHHDNRDLIGVATRLQSSSRGLMGTFKVGRGPEGDRALEKAEDGILDGFSVEVDFGDVDSWQPDPRDESVRLVRQATLRGVAITGTPAFDDARLTSVKASRDNQKGITMPDDKGGNGQPDNFDINEHLAKFAEQTTKAHQSLTEQLGASIGESISAGFKTALESLPTPQDGPQPVRAARYTVTREPPVYAFAGVGHSLVRDAYHATHQNDRDALARLRKYQEQTEEVAKLAAAQLSMAQFAPTTTSTASQIIPPGYRPDLYVSELLRGRPLVNACSRGSIDNASPFTVPVFTSSTGVTADHVEGTNPTEGSVAFATKTVTPGGISGRLILTREIVDSSNPAIDQIALATMRESYARQTEAKVYTLLNGADGAGGVLTPGGSGVSSSVPSGAQASTIIAPLTAAGSQTLAKHIRQELARYPFNRFAAPGIADMGQNATTRLATAEGNDGRPLFPSVGAQNASGVGNSISQGWFIDGLAFVPAWAMTGTAAGDSQIFMLNQADVWVWESPLLSFMFNEKLGPANIELNVFGYFGAHVLRPVGLSGIRITTV